VRIFSCISGLKDSSNTTLKGRMIGAFFIYKSAGNRLKDRGD
jgi:hypothetical protein